MTDHRVGKTVYGVKFVLEGGHGLVELMDTLRMHYRTKSLEELTRKILQKQ